MQLTEIGGNKCCIAVQLDDQDFKFWIWAIYFAYGKQLSYDLCQSKQEAFYGNIKSNDSWKFSHQSSVTYS